MSEHEAAALLGTSHFRVLVGREEGAACWFASEYGDPPIEFEQLGINVTVLEPGQSSVSGVIPEL